jgi:hypothetical protein
VWSKQKQMQQAQVQQQQRMMLQQQMQQQQAVQTQAGLAPEKPKSHSRKHSSRDKDKSSSKSSGRRKEGKGKHSPGASEVFKQQANFEAAAGGGVMDPRMIYAMLESYRPQQQQGSNMYSVGAMPRRDETEGAWLAQMGERSAQPALANDATYSSARSPPDQVCSCLLIAAAPVHSPSRRRHD